LIRRQALVFDFCCANSAAAGLQAQGIRQGYAFQISFQFEDDRHRKSSSRKPDLVEIDKTK